MSQRPEEVPAAAFHHSIRKQTLTIETDTEAQALALQSRMSDINRLRFLPVIERVFEELAVPGRQVRIPRLEVDLGTLPFDTFETAAVERLERELRRVLEETLGELGTETEDGVRQTRTGVLSRPEEHSRVELLEYYLLYGSLPFWAPSRSGFSFEKLFEELAESAPAEVSGLILRHGRMRSVLERLVYQLRDSGLERLTELLDPQHAELIIAYIDDIRQAHRVEPVVSLPEDELVQALWLLAETYLVRDPGTQFNRKTFVRSLLEGIAETWGFEYRQILATLHLGLGRLTHRRSLESSLPAIIVELVRETDLEERTERRRDERRREKKLRKESEERLGAASGLGGLHDTRGSIPADSVDQEGVARSLEAPSRVPGTDPSQSEAENLPADLSFSSSGSRRRLRETVGHVDSSGSGSAAGESRRHAWSDDEGRPREWGSGGRPLEWRRRSGRRRPMASRADHARPVFERYDQLDVLAYYLYFGLLPWSALVRDPKLTVERALAPLPGLPRSLLVTVLSYGSPKRRLAALLRVVRGLSEEGLARLLERLLPQTGGADSPFRSALGEFASQAEDRSLFFARLLGALLEREEIDLEQLAAPLVGSSKLKSELPERWVDWPAHALQSVLLARWRGRGTEVSEASPTELLEALIHEHPQDARQMLVTLRATPELLDAVSRDASPSLFGSMLALLSTEAAETFMALSRALAEVAAPWRPSPGRVHRAILNEALRLAAGGPLDESSFARILAEIFVESVPEAVGETLEGHAVAWSAAERGSRSAHAEALRRAVAKVAGDRPADEPAAAAIAPAQTSSALRNAVLAFLRGPGPAGLDSSAGEPIASELPALSDDALRHATRIFLEESPDEVYDVIRRYTTDRRTRERWVKVLPESTLVRLSYLLEPHQHRAVLDAAEVLASAWLETAPAGHPALTERSELWSFLLDFLARNQGADRLLERLVTAYFEHFSARYRALAPASGSVDVGTRLLEQARRTANATGHGSLLAIFRRDQTDLLASWDPEAPRVESRPEKPDARRERLPESKVSRRRQRPLGGRTAFGLADDVDAAEPEGAIYIDNAGMVLLSPFLPTLFERVELLEEDDEGRVRLRDRKAASRAVHLLQYLVDGRTSAPEPLLVLNKILCGVPTAAAVAREIELTNHEVEVCDHLLQSMIGNWQAISNTSVAGLQETFMQREGRLHKEPEGWKLQVQRKTLDVLVDQVPWSISVVLHRWMRQPVYVTW